MAHDADGADGQKKSNSNSVTIITLLAKRPLSIPSSVCKMSHVTGATPLAGYASHLLAQGGSSEQLFLSAFRWHLANSQRPSAPKGRVFRSMHGVALPGITGKGWLEGMATECYQPRWYYKTISNNIKYHCLTRSEFHVQLYNYSRTHSTQLGTNRSSLPCNQLQELFLVVLGVEKSASKERIEGTPPSYNGEALRGTFISTSSVF